jgi:hypothetical protein
MSSDNSRTSERLRNAAVAAIADMKRPLAAHEIQTWISMHNPNLALELTGKCYDYVRMILSLANKDALQKFRFVGKITGIDCRSTFYGQPHGAYDSAMWRPIAQGHPKRATHTKIDRRKPIPRQSLEHPPPPGPLCDTPLSVGPTTANDANNPATSWLSMSRYMDHSDPFWPVLMEGFPSVQPDLPKEETTDEVIKPVISPGSRIVPPVLVEEIVSMIPKDGNQKQETAWIPDI